MEIDRDCEVEEWRVVEWTRRVWDLFLYLRAWENSGVWWKVEGGQWKEWKECGMLKMMKKKKKKEWRRAGEGWRGG